MNPVKQLRILDCGSPGLLHSRPPGGESRSDRGITIRVTGLQVGDCTDYGAEPKGFALRTMELVDPTASIMANAVLHQLVRSGTSVSIMAAPRIQLHGT
jgi:hypothetical protein